MINFIRNRSKILSFESRNQQNKSSISSSSCMSPQVKKSNQKRLQAGCKLNKAWDLMQKDSNTRKKQICQSQSQIKPRMSFRKKKRKSKSCAISKEIWEFKLRPIRKTFSASQKRLNYAVRSNQPPLTSNMRRTLIYSGFKSLSRRLNQKTQFRQHSISGSSLTWR